MRVYKNDDIIKVSESPVGLFLLEQCGEIICISEYKSGPGDSIEDQHKWRRDAYILSSGENYCGGDELLGNSLIIS